MVSRWVIVGGLGLSSLFAASSNAEDVPNVTFTEHIAPILYRNCAGCHRPGEGAPFSLLTYQDARKRGRLIENVTQDRLMPPWPPSAGWGHFQDERRLSDEQLDQIERWVAAGMPEGPKDKLPPLPKFPAGGWSLGTPDLVLKLPEAFDVPADGPDIYRMFVLPLNLPEDRWVTAVEIRPTARSVVHHALYFLDNTGASRKLDEADPAPGFGRMAFPRTGTLGGWAVGATPRHLPLGLAYSLPKGSDLIVQVHFHPSGKAEREQTSIGLYFAREKPSRSLLGTQAPLAFGLGTALRNPGILPGQKDFTINGRWDVPFDIDLVSIGGHAHYLCKTMKAVAELPDGRELKLFAIDDWDFNWQGRYNYAEPLRLPQGTVIKTELTYDNSEGNPRNPSNPPKLVRWGEGSTDEMGSIGLAFAAVRENDIAAYQGPSIFFGGGDQVGRLGNGRAGMLRGILNGRRPIDPARLREQLEARDVNKDDKLEGDEIPAVLRPFVDRIDKNGDGALDRGELREGIGELMQRRSDAPEAPAPAGERPKAEPKRTSRAESSTPRTDVLTMSDLDGRTWQPLAPATGAPAQVLLFVTHDCPVANHYAQEIGRLARDYKAQGVPFLLVHVDPDLTPEQARKHAGEYQLDLPILLDPKRQLVRNVKPQVTPEAAVVTPDGTVAYCGRIDDRFGKLGRQRPEPSQRDLRDALDAVLAHKPVPVARVEAIGCRIEDLD